MRSSILTILISVTSVVDNNLRKISPKPPVLSPKPNSSEVVKRLSFKREGQDVPAKRQASVNSRLQEEQEAVSERRISSTKEQATIPDTATEKMERRHSPGPESRVSSMIARLSNGSSEPQSTIRTDRQNFMSKIIRKEPEKSDIIPGVGPSENGNHHVVEDDKQVNNDKSQSDGHQESLRSSEAGVRKELSVFAAPVPTSGSRGCGHYTTGPCHQTAHDTTGPCHWSAHDTNHPNLRRNPRHYI